MDRSKTLGGEGRGWDSDCVAGARLSEPTIISSFFLLPQRRGLARLSCREGQGDAVEDVREGGNRPVRGSERISRFQVGMCMAV